MDLFEVGRRFLEHHGAPVPLVAGITGAHAYGFPSPDSDLDLKGIHETPNALLLSLFPPADVRDFLGVFEGTEVDYTSHELARALRLFLRGNGNVLERVLSPLQVLASPAVEELQELCRRGVSRQLARHYRGFLRQVLGTAARAAEPRVKDLLYAYRVALTGTHLLRTGACVLDVRPLAEEYGFPVVADLVLRKAAGGEHVPSTPPASFERDKVRLEEILAEAERTSPLPESVPNVADIDAFLVRRRRAS